MLKIKIDKRYVEDYQMERVKADVNEFKTAFTIGDLKMRFVEETENFELYGLDVISYQIEAIDSGGACGNKTIYAVSMILDGISKVYKVRFYIDQNLEVELRPDLYYVKRFIEGKIQIPPRRLRGQKGVFMTAINISGVLNACDTLSHRIITVGGERRGSAFLFDQCMRAFDCELPAEAVTFSVFINAPVMKAGEATIHRDGRLEMRTV